MRRSDREVRDEQKIAQIMEACTCCRLGMVDAGKPYIVPLNFGFRQENGRYQIYFHSATEGRKIRILRENPEVCFEMDTNYRLNRAELACSHSARFQSVMGTGAVRFLETAEEKAFALRQIMKHSTGREDWTFADESLNRVCVFSLAVDELSCKEHL